MSTAKDTIKHDEKEIVRKWFPILLKTDPEFREEVMSYLTGILATKDDIAKILSKLEEHSRDIAKIFSKLEEHSSNIAKIFLKLEEHSRDIAKILSKLEEHSRVLEEHSKIILEHSKSIEKLAKSIEELVKRMDKFDRTLGAIGARWGVLSEEAFREGISGILKDLGFTVKKWRIRDERGVIFGKISMVEADLLIKDGTHILIEVKSSVSRFDVVGFKKIGELYEEKEGAKPKLVIVSPFINRRAVALAEEIGIECYSNPEEIVE